MIYFFYDVFTAVQNAELLSQPGDSGPHADKGVRHWIQKVRNVVSLGRMWNWHQKIGPCSHLCLVKKN